MPNNEKTDAVRILDLIPEDAIRGTNAPVEFKTLPLYTIVGEGILVEFKTLPFYTIAGEGILKVNMGIRKNPEDIFVFDVTHASEELRTTYASAIIEFEAKKILKEENHAYTSSTGKKIRTMLSLLGNYPSLSLSEQNQVGHNFVTIEALEEGLNIKPLISARNGFPGNTYLEVDPSSFDDELREKLSCDLTELVEMENGLYEQKCTLEQQKEL